MHYTHGQHLGLNRLNARTHWLVIGTGTCGGVSSVGGRAGGRAGGCLVPTGTAQSRHIDIAS